MKWVIAQNVYIGTLFYHLSVICPWIHEDNDNDDDSNRRAITDICKVLIIHQAFETCICINAFNLHNDSL